MNNEYLEHHGIKGMHWGVRRYQNPDGSLTVEGRKRYGGSEKWERRAEKFEARRDAAIKKIGTSKTRVGKFINNDRAAFNQVRANTARDLANAKGISKKVGAVVGHGRLSSINDAGEDFYTRQKEYRKTKLGKHLSSVREYNSHAVGKTHEDIYQENKIPKKVLKAIKHNFDTPMKTLVGRTTVTGERYVNNIIFNATKSLNTVGIGVPISPIADAAYLTKKVIANKKNKSSNKK